MNIRPEKPSDFAAVWRVNFDAFERPGEADLVNILRAEGAVDISLIAEQEGEVVGHILFSPVQISDGDAQWSAVGLAPLAVSPPFHGQGIGSALVKAGLAACQDLGYDVVFVLGHPGFYPKFGFRPSYTDGIRWENAAPADAFMVCELHKGSLLGRKGVVRFHPAFDVVD